MKRYLMTWYGMTDFRASLGLEQTTGPVLGALLAEDYTDVIILGFTHSDKSENKADEFQKKLKNLREHSQESLREFINHFSNSHEAHNHFIKWLNKQLQDSGKTVDLNFSAVDLKHLNDTQGIYEVATQSLNSVAVCGGEKLVTLYLSPGTPVMAFVWAFAALRFPALKKRLIASSQFGKPPETIKLPDEWLEWHGKQIQVSTSEEEKFDVIFHLFGEQRMPSLLSINQFSSQKHIFVNSPKYPATAMRQFIGVSDFMEIAVNPFDPEDVRSTILEFISEVSPNSKIGFNLTGGTKLMYAGALAACRKINATPFYFDGISHQVIFLNDFSTQKTTKIDSTGTFLKLNGDGLKISEEGWFDWNDSENISKLKASKSIWQAKKTLTRNYKHLIPYVENQTPFKIWDGEFYASLDESCRAELHIGEKKFIFSYYPEFASFLVGGWFELFIASLLIPFVEENKIFDLRVNLKLSIDNLDSNENYQFYDSKFKGQSIYQEFDISFTDGYRLFIIECKSGKVTSDMVVKLHEIVKKYGGIDGIGCMISTWRPAHPIIKQKADDFSNIDWIFGENLPNLLEKFIKDKI